ncbi:MAG: YigZ family protein [Butyrivibrio sp.]|nr:YigZ family protein [Butyrivibrio sp.]
MLQAYILITMSTAESYKVITENGSGEIVEKKSRFIANVFYVENAKEAEEKIAEISKKYWDARHNCYAYVIGSGKEITKCSDNGEPSGTAGKPILEVINGSGITNILIIVTRYFGGVLLGTGGLVRAYTQAAQAGIEGSTVGEMVLARELTLEVAYNMVNNVQYFLAQNDIQIKDSVYEANVRFIICVKASELEKIKSGLTQKTEGQITISEGPEGYFPF